LDRQINRRAVVAADVPTDQRRPIATSLQSASNARAPHLDILPRPTGRPPRRYTDNHADRPQDVVKLILPALFTATRLKRRQSCRTARFDVATPAQMGTSRTRDRQARAPALMPTPAPNAPGSRNDEVLVETLETQRFSRCGKAEYWGTTFSAHEPKPKHRRRLRVVVARHEAGDLSPDLETRADNFDTLGTSRTSRPRSSTQPSSGGRDRWLRRWKSNRHAQRRRRTSCRACVTRGPRLEGAFGNARRNVGHAMSPTRNYCSGALLSTRYGRLAGATRAGTARDFDRRRTRARLDVDPFMAASIPRRVMTTEALRVPPAPNRVSRRVHSARLSTRRAERLDIVRRGSGRL